MATKKTTRTTNDARANGEWQGFNWIRKDLRLAIYLRDGMACMWCGTTIEEGGKLTLDHIQPHSKGGSNVPANLVTACVKCNCSRGNRSAKAFAAAASQYVNHGVTATQILTAIKTHLTKDVKSFRTEANAIMSRRPTWQSAIEEASAK